MRYLGGKARIAKKVVEVLEEYRLPNQVFVEPFVGGCNITPLMTGSRIASDLLEEVILFYMALQRGYEPPKVVTELEYKYLKDSPPSPLKGFVGIACSYSGKFFGGYARSGDRNYALNGYNTAKKTAPKIQGVDFRHCSYLDLELPDNSLIYCDPPYTSTTNYSTGKFDSEAFWNWCRGKAEDGHTVIISEYSAPDDFVEIWSIERNLEMRTNKSSTEKRTERLFMLKRKVIYNE